MSELDLLARSQHGLVTCGQLAGFGFHPVAVRRLVLAGRLIPVRRGVYRMCGVTPTWHSAALAAVLAAGPDAVLSHRSAGVLWGLLDRPLPGAPLELTVARQCRIKGIAGHRQALDPSETTLHRHIPVTTVERTIVDLAQSEPTSALGAVIDRALRRSLTSMVRLGAVVERRRGAGRRRLQPVREALADRGSTYDPGANDWERAMDRMWDRLGLPLARRQYRIQVGGGRWYRPDRAILDARIAVDWNGFHDHGTRSGFDYDSDRRARLAANGWFPLDFTCRSAPELICRTVLAVYAERCQQAAATH